MRIPNASWLSSQNQKLNISLVIKRLFQILILCLPIQLAKHFWPSWAYVFGIRVDYLAPALYVTDLLFLVIFAVWIYSLRKTSINSLVKFDNFWLPALVIVGLAGINISVSLNPEVALLAWVKLVEVGLIIFFCAKVKNFELTTWLVKPLLLGAFGASVVGLIQFLLGHSLGGLMYWLGERPVASYLPSIATFNLNGQSFLRAYSVFSHPNSLAGYLGLTLIVWSRRLITTSVTRVEKVLVIFVGIGLLTTFSFSALFFLTLILLGVRFFPKFHQLKALTILLLLGAIGVSAFEPGLAFLQNLPPTINERLVLARSSALMLIANPLTGVGLNNFVVSLTKYGADSQVVWLLQPVHNIFLLTLSEVGLVGFSFFLWGVFKVISNFQNQDKGWLVYPLLFVLLTGSMDHYWFTLQQNIFLLAIIIGLSFRKLPAKLSLT